MPVDIVDEIHYHERPGNKLSEFIHPGNMTFTMHDRADMPDEAGMVKRVYDEDQIAGLEVLHPDVSTVNWGQTTISAMLLAYSQTRHA